MKHALYILPAIFVAFFAAAPALADTEATLADTVCPLCGLCPAPGGLCLFLIAAVLLAAAIIILLLAGLGKRCPLCKTRCKRHEYSCPHCGYDFESGLQSTMTIRVADSPELMALRQQATPSPSTVSTPPAAPSPFPGPAPAAEPQIGKLCPVCGAALPAKAMFCGKCGRRLD